MTGFLVLILRFKPVIMADGVRKLTGEVADLTPLYTAYQAAT